MPHISQAQTANPNISANTLAAYALSNKNFTIDENWMQQNKIDMEKVRQVQRSMLMREINGILRDPAYYTGNINIQ